MEIIAIIAAAFIVLGAFLLISTEFFGFVILENISFFLIVIGFVVLFITLLIDLTS